MKTNFNVVNFHLTGKCNYKCVYCFAKFGNCKELSVCDAKKVVDCIANYFDSNGINGRINLVGGEPLLVGYLDELIDYICECDIKVSIVTNGSLLTKDKINSYKGRVDTIGLSVDSICDATNKSIGRTCKNKSLSESKIVEIAQTIKDNGIKLKVNTVVSKLNINEDLGGLYDRIIPDRVKIFQMLVMDGVNNIAKSLAVNSTNFEKYCNKVNFVSAVRENSIDMIDSYLMINPYGEMVTDRRGYYKIVGSCLKESFESLLIKNNPDIVKFGKRYNAEG